MTTDEARDAWRSVTRRPRRSILTSLGVCLGVAAVVAIVAMTTSGSLQVARRFDAFSATTLTIDLPVDAHLEDLESISARLATLPGVVTAGIYATLTNDSVPVAASSRRQPRTRTIPVIIASSNGMSAADPTLIAGALPTRWAEQQRARIAVIGESLAHEFAVTPTPGEQSITLNGHPFDVVAIISDASDSALLSASVILSPGAARILAPDIKPQSVLVRTEEGAAQQVAQWAPLAAYPENPAAVSVQIPPQPDQLRGRITRDTRDLIVALAVVTLAAAAVGITNTMLLAVWERQSEIGIRRSLGATRPSIAALFLTEAAIMGTLGGLAGAFVGIFVGAGVAASRGWAYAVPPAVLLAPMLGTIVGIAAGVYPALSATRLDPIDSLRS